MIGCRKNQRPLNNLTSYCRTPNLLLLNSQHRHCANSNLCTILSKTHNTMASITMPRAALRSLIRAAPSVRSSTPRIATRCLHQKSSPITSAPAQHRPRAQPWSQGALSPAATVTRRTMFIQTEPTPNADVSASIFGTLRRTDMSRLSSSTPTCGFFLKRYHQVFSNMSRPVRLLRRLTPPHSQPSS